MADNTDSSHFIRDASALISKHEAYLDDTRRFMFVEGKRVVRCQSGLYTVGNQCHEKAVPHDLFCEKHMKSITNHGYPVSAPELVSPNGDDNGR